MKALVVKYLAVFWVFILGFANFVACGSQFYKVSLEEDHDIRAASKSNPEMSTPGSPTFGVHSTEGWKNLPIAYAFGEGMNADQRKHLAAAMAIWETAVGKKLFKVMGVHKGITGDSFKDLYSSLDDGINGDYLDDHWKKTNKPDYVLATTIWNSGSSSDITTADIRFNSESYLIGDSLHLQATDTKEVVDMQSLALHELGHLLGLGHLEESIDGESIMNPTLFIGAGLTSRHLSEGDIIRIQSIYGCQGDACDTTKTLQAINKLDGLNLVDPISAH